MLQKVKTALGIVGTYQDGTIQSYINEVKQFLIDGGVDPRIVNSDKAAGIITRGVADLWNYGSGGTSFSPYFIQRAVQLASLSYSESTLEERVAALEVEFENLNQRLFFVENFINLHCQDCITNETDVSYEFLDMTGTHYLLTPIDTLEVNLVAPATMLSSSIINFISGANGTTYSITGVLSQTGTIPANKNVQLRISYRSTDNPQFTVTYTTADLLITHGGVDNANI